jgi:hypothetical protein
MNGAFMSRCLIKHRDNSMLTVEVCYMTKYRFEVGVQLLFQKFHLMQFSAPHFPYFENDISQRWCATVVNVCIVLIFSY